ncbi:MAG: hypothetical protein KAG56_05720 [Sulfurovaceae bacterium]|nr:hypothetical protein [Sulfurovaceae bacterium]
MRNQTALEELMTKTSLLVEKFNKEKEKNLLLSQELNKLQKEIEVKNQKIIQLKEDEEFRDMELDDITKKISKLLA